jgi:hypothetical protein
MIVSGSNNLSDESDDEVENGEVDTYRRKYQLLLERCEVLQQVTFFVFVVDSLWISDERCIFAVTCHVPLSSNKFCH